MGWFRKPATTEPYSRYGVHLVTVAAGDAARVADSWHAGGIDLDWQQKFQVLYELVLYYLHITDRYVAQHRPGQRQRIMDAVTGAAWYAWLTRSVVKPIPEDLSDPATVENFRGFTEDLHLRHELYAPYVWERADDPDNFEGTLFWEFPKFVSRSLGYPDDLITIMGVQMAMLNSLEFLNSAQLLDP